MKRFISVVAIALLFITGASVSAQSKPTFAGKWTMVPESERRSRRRRADAEWPAGSGRS
jgi:hypothetical protein